MEHLGFFYQLKDYGVPVSVKYILDFHEALNRNLGGGLNQIYTLLRLTCIKRLEHIDPFERAFAKYYLDLELPPPGEPVDLPFSSPYNNNKNHPTFVTRFRKGSTSNSKRGLSPVTWMAERTWYTTCENFYNVDIRFNLC